MASVDKGAGLVSEAAPDGLKEWMAANDVFRPLQRAGTSFQRKAAANGQRQRDMREIARLAGVEVEEDLDPADEVAVVDRSKLVMKSWPIGVHSRVATAYVPSFVAALRSRADAGDLEWDGADGDGTLSWRVSGKAHGHAEVVDWAARSFSAVVVCREGKPERIARRAEGPPPKERGLFDGFADFLSPGRRARREAPEPEIDPESLFPEDAPKPARLSDEPLELADEDLERLFEFPGPSSAPSVPRGPRRQVSVAVGEDAWAHVSAEAERRGFSVRAVVSEAVRERLADPSSPPPLAEVGGAVGRKSLNCLLSDGDIRRLREVFGGKSNAASVRAALFGVASGRASPAPVEPEPEPVEPEPDDGFDPLPDWPEGEADAGDRDLTEADVRKIERLAFLEFERRSLARRIAELEKSCAIEAVDLPGRMDIDAARGLSRAQLDVACANAERRTGRPVPGRRRRRLRKAIHAAAAVTLFAAVVGYAAS